MKSFPEVIYDMEDHWAAVKQKKRKERERERNREREKKKILLRCTHLGITDEQFVASMLEWQRLIIINTEVAISILFPPFSSLFLQVFSGVFGNIM